MLQRIKGFFDARFMPSDATGADDTEHVLRVTTGALWKPVIFAAYKESSS
jgi:hypothetical protein